MAIYFLIKRLDVANSTIGKVSGRLEWDGKVFPRRMLFLGRFPKIVTCPYKKVVNFGAGPDPYFSASVNPALLPDKNTPGTSYKAATPGRGKGGSP